MSAFVFVPPATIEEARARQLVVAARVQDIQAQLADRNRVDPATGERLGDREWHEWRHRAVFALGRSQSEGRALKRWVADHESRRTAAERAARGGPYASALRKAVAIVRDAATLADAERALHGELAALGATFEVTP